VFMMNAYYTEAALVSWQLNPVISFQSLAELV
jgi:hypothetical protein